MKPLPPLLKVALVSVCQLVKDEGVPIISFNVLNEDKEVTGLITVATTAAEIKRLELYAARRKYRIANARGRRDATRIVNALLASYRAANAAKGGRA